MLLQKIYVVPIRTKCGKDWFTQKFSGTAAHLSYLFSFNWILQRNGISKIILRETDCVRKKIKLFWHLVAE